jgi:hypothetical protein
MDSRYRREEEDIGHGQQISAIPPRGRSSIGNCKALLFLDFTAMIIQRLISRNRPWIERVCEVEKKIFGIRTPP